MFTYYKPIVSREHYLFASELARAYGIYSTTGRPHALFVTALMNAYYKHTPREELYYETRHGLKRVFPDGEKVLDLMIDKFRALPGKVKNYEIEGRKYKIVLEEKKER